MSIIARTGSNATTAAIAAVAACSLSALPPALAQDLEARGLDNADDDAIVVATALPATYAIASALAGGTSIEVRLVPEGGRRLTQLPSLFERRPERLGAALADADAVVTIGKLWPDDPLYAGARAANIRVVDIDATKPFSLSLEGIAVAAAPVDNAYWAPDSANGTGDSARERSPSVYFWLSPANGARAAEIVARDLARLAPEDRARIDENLGTFRTEMLAIQTEFALEFAAMPDLTVAALAPEFIYLTNGFGIYVDSYFLKQDIDWTDEDLTAFTSYLGDNGIGVVIHKWEPAERIADAVDAAGAELVVLDPIDLGIEENGGIAADSYQQLLRANLSALHDALAAANR